MIGYLLLLLCIILLIGTRELPYCSVSKSTLLYEDISNKKRESAFNLFFVYIIIVLFAGLRGAFTSDYSAYIKIFNDIRTLTYQETLQSGNMEKGFLLLTKIISSFTSSGVIYMLCLAAITYGLFCLSFYKYSPMPCLSCLLFVSVGDYFAGFNLVRQMLAVSVTFYAMTFIKEKKCIALIKYIAAKLIAATIHKTALVMLPLYFLKYIKLTSKALFFWGICFFLATIFVMPFVSLMKDLLPSYRYEYGNWNGTINAVIPFLGIAFFVACSPQYTDLDLNKTSNYIWCNYLIMSLIILTMGCTVYIMTRIALYVKSYVCILIPIIIERINFSYKITSGHWKKILIVLIELLAVLFVIITLSGTGYVPYYMSEEIFGI